MKAQRPIVSPAAGGLSGLHPAYFALVMATGIVSIAAQLLGFALIGQVLFALNVVFYPVLWALTLARVVSHRARMVADFVDHNRSVGFFTIVAANNVFGSQCLVIGGLVRVALALWIVGIALWAALTYAIFTALTIKRQKPSLGDGIHGGWLVAVVAGQSVVVLGARVALSTHAEAALFFCFAMWLGGAMLYLWIIGLIFYRYTFFVLSPSDLAPPYWINMGAAAITALAGSTLILASPSSTVLRDALPFVRGFTLLWWSTATWWIPMLFMLGLWRYALCRFPLRYDPLYWGAVFPLGMYTACTIGVSTALGAPYLMVIPRFFFYLAFVAWSVTMLGLIASAVRRDSSAAKSASSAGAP